MCTHIKMFMQVKLKKLFMSFITDETSNTEATEVQTTTQQYTSRKCKQKVNSLMSNDSDIPDPVKPKGKVQLF